MMAEKKNLRKVLREMKVGEMVMIPRTDFLPSSIRATASSVKEDFGYQYTISTQHPDAVEVKRVS